jgi:signal transduction histidine kinase
MRKKRSARIVVTYVLSLLVTIALLVVWVIYVVGAATRLNELGRRVGAPAGNFHWVVLTVGCALFSLLIVGVTWQLAHSLAERRYSRKQEELVSNITHEMKSPLAAITLHAQTLETPGLDEASRLRSTRFILQQADRLGRLIDNVLESSRLVARRRRLDLAPVDLAGFFGGYFDEVRARTEGHGVLLGVRLDTAARVMATPEALHRVMDNLLDNAVRFSERGGEVRCAITDHHGVARIEVEDDGIGIPKKELPKIFDGFYQAGRQSDGRRRGSGLGLAIVSGLVREMRGTVQAFSHEGRPGTRFVIELPRVEGAAAAPGEAGA